MHVYVHIYFNVCIKYPKNIYICAYMSIYTHKLNFFDSIHLLYACLFLTNALFVTV